VDVGIHFLIGSFFERIARRKLWLYLLPAYLTHVYIDLLTVHFEIPLNWFGFEAGWESTGSLIRWVGFAEFWNVNNILTITVAVGSIILWLIFLRRYWKGVIFSWAVWDGLWVLQEMAFYFGFRLPVTHPLLMKVITTGPIFFVAHVIMITFLVSVVWLHPTIIPRSLKTAILKPVSIFVNIFRF
jgi:hypothetical protein